MFMDSIKKMCTFFIRAVEECCSVYCFYKFSTFPSAPSEFRPIPARTRPAFTCSGLVPGPFFENPENPVSRGFLLNPGRRGTCKESYF